MREEIRSEDMVNWEDKQILPLHTFVQQAHMASRETNARPTQEYRVGQSMQGNDESQVLEEMMVNIIRMDEPIFSKEAFRHIQDEDKVCKDIMKKLNNKGHPKFTLQDGILYKRMETERGTTQALVIPRKVVPTIMSNFHKAEATYNHFGPVKMYLDLKRRFYWPKMKDDVDMRYRNCIRCTYNQRYPIKHKLGNAHFPARPGSTIHLDCLTGLSKSARGDRAVLVMIDKFSRFGVAVPLKSEKAKAISEAFVERYLMVYGVPKMIITDNHPNFIGQTLSHICKIFGIRKYKCPPISQETMVM